MSQYFLPNDSICTIPNISSNCSALNLAEKNLLSKNRLPVKMLCTVRWLEQLPAYICAKQYFLLDSLIKALICRQCKTKKICSCIYFIRLFLLNWKLVSLNLYCANLSLKGCKEKVHTFLLNIARSFGNCNSKYQCVEYWYISVIKTIFMSNLS